MAKKIIDPIFIFDGINKVFIDLYHCPSNGGDLPFERITTYYNDKLEVGQWVEVECRSTK